MMIYMYIYSIHIKSIYVYVYVYICIYIYKRHLQTVKCNTLLTILPHFRTPQGWVRLMKTEYTLYFSPLFSTLGLCGQDMPR